MRSVVWAPVEYHTVCNSNIYRLHIGKLKKKIDKKLNITTTPTTNWDHFRQIFRNLRLKFLKKWLCFLGLLTLSPRRGGGGVVATLLSDFPSYHFCIFAKIAIRSIYPPFVQIPMHPWKKFAQFLPWKKLGGGGCNNPPPPPILRGKG